MHTTARGNAIPETAAGISYVLLMLFGVIQYGLVGFNQLGADGAAFVGDHATVAEYQNPTSSNVSYAQRVAQAIFPHASESYSATIPKSGTYEMDLQGTGITQALTPLFPSSVQTRSRIIEPSQNAANLSSRDGLCTIAAENITNGGTTILNAPVGLLQGGVTSSTTSGVFKVVSSTNGGSALAFDSGSYSAQVTALSTMSADLTASAVKLTAISTILSVAPIVTAPIAQSISSSVAPLLAAAAGGSISSGAQISEMTPLSPSAFSAQETAATNSINLSIAGNSLAATLAPLLAAPLYGTSASPGLLSGGPNGGILGDMNVAENVLYGVDSTSPKTCLP